MTNATIDTHSFVNAILWTTRSFDAKDNSASITLSLSTEGENFLSYGNQVSYMKAPVSVINIDEDITLSLDGNYLQRLASVLSSGEVELDYKDDSLHLKSSAGKFTVPIFDSRPAKQPDMTNIGSIDEKDYLDYLQRFAKICDMASAGLHPFLGTVDVSPSTETKKITIMATDRYTLGEVVLDFYPSEDAEEVLGKEANLLIPYESASMISPSKTAGAIDLLYDKDSDKFGYSFNDGRIALFSLQDVSRLKYKDLKEGAKNNTNNSFVVKTRDLQKAISDISKLDWDSSEILLEVTEDKVIISDENKTNKLEVASDSINVDEDYTIKFSRTVINKGFVPVATEKVKIFWNDATSPFIVQPVLDNGEDATNVFILTIPAI